MLYITSNIIQVIYKNNFFFIFFKTCPGVLKKGELNDKQGIFFEKFSKEKVKKSLST